MTWDLFSSMDPARPPSRAQARNEALARAVAARDTRPAGRRRPAAAEEWTVAAVNAAAREVVEGVFPPLWVSGEVTGFTRARSGHCYFSLRDRESQLRCVMWRDEARRLPTSPAEGMAVRALGRLTVYEQRGEFQLVVSELEGRGEGLWKLAFDRLRTRLEIEGVTAPERKRALPKHPECVGIVTSSAGAALHDIVHVVRRRAPWTKIVVCSCRVQGEGAADEIARAIRLFGTALCADVLIVGRGGGSVEDLWAFNEEVVARALADSPVPTISAVGHETDFTIADLVADVRAPTPSAAAEAAVPDGRHVRRALESAGARLVHTMQSRIGHGRVALDGARADLMLAATSSVQARRERLGGAAAQLHALSPLGALARGFAVPVGADGKVLRRRGEFRPGAEIRLRVVDGVVPCRVERGTDQGEAR